MEKNQLTRLTEHFYLEEFTKSETLYDHNLKNPSRLITNTPTPIALENIKKLARKMEWFRMLIGCPIFISSGYRSKGLNNLVNGSPTSRHLKGLAADVITTNFDDMLQLMYYMLNDKDTRECYLSYAGKNFWIHYSFEPDVDIDERLCRTGVDWFHRLKAMNFMKNIE